VNNVFRLVNVLLNDAQRLCIWFGAW